MEFIVLKAVLERKKQNRKDWKKIHGIFCVILSFVLKYQTKVLVIYIKWLFFLSLFPGSVALNIWSIRKTIDTVTVCVRKIKPIRKIKK